MKKQGFTLVELLAVIVIMGIILAIAVPSTVGVIDKAKRDAHVKNAQVFTNNVKTYLTQNGVTADSGKGVCVTFQALIDAQLLSLPKHPDNGNYDATKSYVIMANIPNEGIQFYVQLAASGTTNNRGIKFSSSVEAQDLTANNVTTETSWPSACSATGLSGITITQYP